MPLVSLTLATLRKAEFGFFGVVVYTFKHTPRIKGAPVFIKIILFLIRFILLCSAGDLLLDLRGALPFRTSWFTVGIKHFLGGTKRTRFFSPNPRQRRGLSFSEKAHRGRNKSVPLCGY